MKINLNMRPPRGRLASGLLCLILGLTCLACSRQDDMLEAGIWRATVRTDSGAEIPFNFEVKADSTAPYLEVINGDNRMRVDEISREGDSLRIVMPFFDSEFMVRAEGDRLNGRWIKHLAGRDAVMPFNAVHGLDYRFMQEPEKPAADLSGRWAASFLREEGEPTPAIGEFRQEGSRLTGSFLMPTGDYRFLEGTVSGEQVFLSSFDGGYATLFTARLGQDSLLLDGKFYSGRSGLRQWSARRDAQASLPDAYSLTYLEEGYERLEFAYPNLEGDTVSLDDQRFRGKVVVVQFFGSWCPNCLDETRFLSDFYRKYRGKGLEIVGLAYERTTDLERSKVQVQRMLDRFDVEYEMLLTGYTNAQVEESMPSLRNFMAFPTTILIDRQGQVRKIHTGFSGPGTGVHYERHVEEFTRLVEELLKEPAPQLSLRVSP